MKPTTTRGLAVIGMMVVVAILLAACGGGSPSSSSTKTTTNAADTHGATSASGSEARREALASCLKKYGVTLPSFGGATGASGRHFPFGASGASGRHFPFGASGASGRHFPFGASGASGRHFPFGASGASGSFGGYPGGGGFSAGNPKLAQALEKCGGSAGFGRFGATGRTGVFSTQIRTELTSFVACMKKNGVTLPKPNLSGSGSVFGNVNQTTAAFKAAYAKCEGILTYLHHRPTGATGATDST